MKVIQINLNNCKAANFELLKYMSENKMDIRLIQDFHTTNGSFLCLPIIQSFYQSVNQTEGIIILIHVQTLETDNNVFINLTTKNHHRKIGSQYSRPSGNLERDILDWSQQIQNCSRVVIEGDFNGHLPVQGYRRNNAIGDTFLYHLSLNDLFIANNPDSDN